MLMMFFAVRLQFGFIRLLDPSLFDLSILNNNEYVLKWLINNRPTTALTFNSKPKGVQTRQSALFVATLKGFPDIVRLIVQHNLDDPDPQAKFWIVTTDQQRQTVSPQQPLYPNFCK